MGTKPKNFNKPGNFLPGNQAAKGKGRPRTPLRALRKELAQEFLEETQKNFKPLCDRLFLEASNGNIRAIELIFSWALPKPSPIDIEDLKEDEDEEISLTVERIKKMTTDELLTYMSKYIRNIDIVNSLKRQ